jgi:hypothetical protein
VRKVRPIEFHLDALMAAPTVTCLVALKVNQMLVDWACLKKTRKEFDLVALVVSC